MKNILILFSILITSYYMAYCQKDIYNTNTRSIVITCADSVVKANILTIKEDIKFNDELKYYWYNNNMIGYNRGGVSGKPLHGTYSVFNSEGLLLTQGSFENGLKIGKWKRWYASGELRRIENYEKGLLHGERKSFSENEELIITSYFKKGTKVTSEDKSFFSKIFKKEKTAEKDSTENEAEDKSSD